MLSSIKQRSSDSQNPDVVQRHIGSKKYQQKKAMVIEEQEKAAQRQKEKEERRAKFLAMRKAREAAEKGETVETDEDEEDSEEDDLDIVSARWEGGSEMSKPRRGNPSMPHR